MRLEIDIEKAKEIQANRWREARKPLLEKLDILHFKFSEDVNEANEEFNKNLLKAISKHKQVLRDVTKTDLSRVTSIKELKSIWPKCLTMKHNA